MVIALIVALYAGRSEGCNAEDGRAQRRITHWSRFHSSSLHSSSADIPLPFIPLPLVLVCSVESCLADGNSHDSNIDAHKQDPGRGMVGRGIEGSTDIPLHSKTERTCFLDKFFVPKRFCVMLSELLEKDWTRKSELLEGG